MSVAEEMDPLLNGSKEGIVGRGEGGTGKRLVMQGTLEEDKLRLR